MSLLKQGFLRPAIIGGLLLHVAVAALLSFIPLFDVLGFERAFVTSLLAAPTTAMGAISLCLWAQKREQDPPTTKALAWAATLFGLAMLIPTVVAGFLVERSSTPCSPAEGLGFLALSGGTAAIFGAGLGLSAAATIKAHRSPRLLVWLILLAALGAALWRLYSQPQIFAFSIPFGYWPGSLYDEEVKVGRALIAERGLALAIGLALLSFAVTFTDAAAARLASPLRHKGALLLFLLSCASAVGLWRAGESLGFDQDRATIERALARHVETPHFQLFVDPSISEEKLTRLVEDHELRYAQLVRFFGRGLSERVKSYVYRDSAQKKRLMGAGGTQVSRPWAGEFHIDGFDTPHPIMKHELAHVFAGSFGEGILKSPAKLGVMVNLTLIEGLAVAADWPAKGLTIHEWARAMRALKLAPDIRTSLYPAGFWAVSSSRAYTIAGSFIRHLIDTRGVPKFMEAYAKNDLEAVYGTSLDALATEWEATIDALPLAKESLDMAEHRFRSPSIFQRVCAHTTANLVSQGYARLSAGDLDGAAALLERAHNYDPSRVDVLLTLAKAFAAKGRLEDAERVAAKARDVPGMTARGRAMAIELLADLDWKSRRPDEARAKLHGILDLHLAEESDRLMQVKLRALDEPPEVSAALRSYLAQEIPTERAVAVLSELSHARRDDVVVRYLYAKLLENVGASLAAATEARAALDLGLPTPELSKEARLIEARSLLLAGKRAEAGALFQALTSTASPAALRIEAADWAERARAGGE